MNKNENRQSLDKVLGTKDVIALAFGTIVGGGWVLLADGWIAQAGAIGVALAFAVAAGVCVFIGMTYAELTPALPLSGGEMVYAYRAMGFHGGFITAWMLTLTYTGICCWVGTAFAKSLNYMIPIPSIKILWWVSGSPVHLSWILISIVGTVVMCLINHFGIQSSSRFQNVMTVLLAVIGIGLIVTALIFGSPGNLNPPITSGRSLFIILLATPAMYAGFNIIPQTAEEMNIPRSKIGKMLVLSILVVAVWYFLLMVGNGFLATPGEYAHTFTQMGIVQAFERAVNSKVLGNILILGVIFGLLTTWNGFILGSSRLFYSMARAKMLPPIFAKLHPKHKTPTASILLIGVVGCVTPLVGEQILSWLINAESFAMVCAYLSVSLSFLILRRKEPGLERPFVVKQGSVIGIFALVFSALFIVLYFPVVPGGGLVWQEWLIVAIWVVFGLIMMAVNQSTHKDVTLAEREYLIFGEEFARPWILNKTE